ncbi:hypothetical protein N8146_05040 [Ascidiaceihabitans sp.]|nr:hypothetical protein [Ascidiaceihabitans sp.]
MTIRLIMMASAFGTLAACQPALPESGAGAPGQGVGFDTSDSARAQLDAPLTVQSQTLRSSDQQNQAVTSEMAQVAATVNAQTSSIANDTLAALGNDVARTSVEAGRQVVNASPSNPAPVAVNNAGISDENDFGAVSGRHSIESDKARIAENRAQYAVVQPTALPSRSGSNQLNVVAYALETQHPRGTQVHRRLGFASVARTQRNCAKYNSADDAQLEFLTRGGPTRDRLALDPDGDGYACDWNPAKYRG